MLNKKTLNEFNKLGYTIHVSYSNTQYLDADVDLNSLNNAENTDEVAFTNEDVNETSFNCDSEEYSIYKNEPQSNAPIKQICIADGLLFDDLEHWINKLVTSPEATEA